MSKAIAGAALLAGAAIGATILTGGFAIGGILALTTTELNVLGAVALGGASMLAGSIADALTSNRGTNITTRQAASFRQIIYGEQRVGGILIYESTTGSHHNQYNHVIVIAGHEVDSIVNLYLDGRQVFWSATNTLGNTTRNGVNFGGAANGDTHTGPGGQQYNFGGLVYCEARFGDQAPGDVILGLTANDPTWVATGDGSPWVGGCAYIYLKVEYDANMFSSPPESRVTVRGKNNIYDPRTGTSGYSTNAALIVADVLTDTQFGLGDVGAVNTAQLIAAANVCDEQVACAAGMEARYALHWHYDTGTAPGDALQQMMSAMGGRLSRIGGEWFIWPAYWQGPSFTWDANVLADGFTWKPNRSYRDLVNRVAGTYIAPNFPYNILGNLYDANGFYEGSIQNNFNFAFQPTNYPQYAADALHGYPDDEYLNSDGGQPLPMELSLSCVLSVSQAQRLAKIALMRNRKQGTGSFTMFLEAARMQPCDVYQMNFPQLGWTNKLLEVNQFGFSVAEGKNKAPVLTVQLGVNETGPDVYEWDPAEELTIYDVPASPVQQPYIPAAPTNITLTSSAATAIVGADGVAQPRIKVSWDEPLDGFVTQVQMQYQAVGAAAWTDGGLVDVSLDVGYLAPVIAGQSYNVRIRSVRSSGALSAWIGINGFAAGLVLSSVTSAGLNPNSPYNVDNNATINSIVEGSAATIRIYGPGGDGTTFTRYVGSAAISMNPAHLTGEAFTSIYYLVYNTVSATYLALTNYNDTLADAYVPIGSLVTCDPTYSGTGTGGGDSGGGGELPGGGRNFTTSNPN